jgi:hypothetical protein
MENKNLNYHVDVERRCHMRKLLKTFSFAFILILMLCVWAVAQAPNTIAYQGRLADVDGNPVTGDVTDVMFSLYDGPDPAVSVTPLWSETISITCDEQGVFTAELGTATPLTQSIFNGIKLYLGVKVGDDDEMAPRQLITSAPYAVNAGIANGAVTSSKLADDAVINTKIANNAVLGVNVQNGSLSDLDIVDEPGIAAARNTSSIILPLSGYVDLDSVIFSAPTSGYVVLLASLTWRPQHTTGTRDLARFSISETSGTYSGLYSQMMTAPANDETDFDRPMPVAFHRVDAVTAGQHKYYLIGNGFAGSSRATQIYFTAMFFPTNYGTVDTSPPGAGKIKDFVPDPTLTDDGMAKAGVSYEVIEIKPGEHQDSQKNEAEKE